MYKRQDGVCYNSKGISIEDLVADAEPLFLEAGRRGVYTIGVDVYKRQAQKGRKPGLVILPDLLPGEYPSY